MQLPPSVWNTCIVHNGRHTHDHSNSERNILCINKRSIHWAGCTHAAQQFSALLPLTLPAELHFPRQLAVGIYNAHIVHVRTSVEPARICCPSARLPHVCCQEYEALTAAGSVSARLYCFLRLLSLVVFAAHPYPIHPAPQLVVAKMGCCSGCVFDVFKKFSVFVMSLIKVGGHGGVLQGGEPGLGLGDGASVASFAGTA